MDRARSRRGPSIRVDVSAGPRPSGEPVVVVVVVLSPIVSHRPMRMDRPVRVRVTAGGVPECALLRKRKRSNGSQIIGCYGGTIILR